MGPREFKDAVCTTIIILQDQADTFYRCGRTYSDARDVEVDRYMEVVFQDKYRGQSKIARDLLFALIDASALSERRLEVA